MWGRALEAAEVARLRRQCEQYSGDLVPWPRVYSGLRGHIKVGGGTLDTGTLLSFRFLL